MTDELVDNAEAEDDGLGLRGGPQRWENSPLSMGSSCKERTSVRKEL